MPILPCFMPPQHSLALNAGLQERLTRIVKKAGWYVQEGDSLEMKGPLPKFPYKANMKKKIGMVGHACMHV